MSDDEQPETEQVSGKPSKAPQSAVVTHRAGKSTKRRKKAANSVTAPPTSTMERTLQACNLRLAGFTYAQIATELGLSSPSYARQIVVKALEESINETAAELRVTQNNRYEQLLMTHWGKAIDPQNEHNVQATHTVLSIMDRINAINGVNAPVDVHVTGGTTSTVIHVAGGDSTEYIAAMQAAVEQQKQLAAEQAGAIDTTSEEKS